MTADDSAPLGVGPDQWDEGDRFLGDRHDQFELRRGGAEGLGRRRVGDRERGDKTAIKRLGINARPVVDRHAEHRGELPAELPERNRPRLPELGHGLIEPLAERRLRGYRFLRWPRGDDGGP